MLELINTKEWLSKPRRVCGVMTGTSMDGIDIAFAEFSLQSGKHIMNTLAHKHYDFSEGIAGLIKECINPSTNKKPADILCLANSELGNEYARAIKQALEETKLSAEAIGLHGQTVSHFAYAKGMATFQIGAAPIVSQKLGIPVVYDFRTADIALGGQGAPLAPIFDKAFLAKEDEAVIALNIGGISNITCLPANSVEITAFDTGPGNCIIDRIAKDAYDLDYDKDGIIAAQGKAVPWILDKLKEDDYFKIMAPKSSHTDYWLELYSLTRERYKLEDIMATYAEFTAWSIAEGIKSYAGGAVEVIAAGGGSRNKYIMQKLKEYLPGMKITCSEDHGIPYDAKEALCFAYLAWLRLCGFPGNIPSATGARGEARLGSISLP